MAFIWKRQKTQTWYLDYTPPGGKRTRKRIGKSKQAAELALKQVEYQLSFDRAGITVGELSLGEFFDRYEETIRPKLRPRSWTRYRAIIDHFRAFLGPRWAKLRVQQLSREVFEQYVSWRRSGQGAFPDKNGNGSRPAKAKTINNELDMLASMFNKGVEWGYLARNPVHAISRLKEDDRRPFRFFSNEEIELLRLVADLLDQQASSAVIELAVDDYYEEHQDLRPAEEPVDKSEEDSARRNYSSDTRRGALMNSRLIVDFLLTTGSRKDEMLSLEWSWIDLKRGTISYRRRANWVPKGSERDLALRPEVLQRLKVLPKTRDVHRVFLDWHGKPIPPRTFERGIQRIINLARLPKATIHDFRHTFASHLAMAGVPLPTIQQLLGHRDVQTVMIYAHLSPSHVRDSINALPF